jgi:hypothetical protein
MMFIPTYYANVAVLISISARHRRAAALLTEHVGLTNVGPQQRRHGYDGATWASWPFKQARQGKVKVKASRLGVVRVATKHGFLHGH